MFGNVEENDSSPVFSYQSVVATVCAILVP